MVVLTTIRQSPAYLYLKAYCLCALVSLFQVAPVTSRLPDISARLHHVEYRIITTRLGKRLAPVKRYKSWSRVTAEERPRDAYTVSSLGSMPDQVTPLARQHPFRNRLKTWYWRAVDLAQIKMLLRRDEKDLRTYPELNWDATVRRSSSLHPEEKQFIELRKRRISSEGADSLHSFLGLPEGVKVDPRDVPLIALGGSGGGYRAMYGFAAFMSASKKLGLWDCLTWAAGVSGSCWTLAAYYTIAYHDVSKLVRHYLSVAEELAHPLSVQALDSIARSSGGVYFLLGPLVRKAQNQIIGLGIMDLYATLTTTYQLLSREPGAKLSRSTFQFSKVWYRSGINKAAEPMPIMTAVRRAPKNSTGVQPRPESSISKGQPPRRALEQHHSMASNAMDKHRQNLHLGSPKTASLSSEARTEPPDSSSANGFFQWFEISPLEVGSSDLGGTFQLGLGGAPSHLAAPLDGRPSSRWH